LSGPSARAISRSTATEEPVEKRLTADGAEVIDFPLKNDGGGLDRTADLGIMSLFERDSEEPD
jgi:hypothetical protein